MQEMQKTRVWSLGQEDPLEKEMANHYSILAWTIPRTERAWWTIIRWVAKGQTQLSAHTHTHTHIFHWFHVAVNGNKAWHPKRETKIKNTHSLSWIQWLHGLRYDLAPQQKNLSLLSKSTIHNHLSDFTKAQSDSVTSLPSQTSANPHCPQNEI